MKYHHILIATDLTEDSGKVVHKAADFAKQVDAKLSIIHVIEPFPAYNYPFIGSPDLEMELSNETKKQLAKIGKTYKIPEENQYVEIGPTKTEIIELAKEKKVDLIIVGSHGHHGFGALLGATANAVAHSAYCDVLVVRLGE